LRKEKILAAGIDIPTSVCSAVGHDNRQPLMHLMPPQPEASVLTVACRPDDFSASLLARAVEDSNAHLINLNVTDCRLDDGRITVELRTNLRTPASTARSLERYGFEVIEATGQVNGMTRPDSDDELRERAAELLHLINI